MKKYELIARLKESGNEVVITTLRKANLMNAQGSSSSVWYRVKDVM